MNYSNNINLIVSDLDGTLLSSDGSISKANLNTIKKLADIGILFTIASGRPDKMCSTFIKQLNINIPVISSNGALIRDISTNAVIHKNIINYSTALNIIKFCQENLMDYMVYTEDKVFFTTYSKRISKFHRYNEISISNGVTPMALHFFDNNFEDICLDGVIKILICQNNSGDLEKANLFLSEFSKIDYLSSEATVLDISSKGTSKGQALIHLANYLNIDLSNICAFGDFSNDITMLKNAGLSIAMGNSEESVKKIADIITDTNDNNGVSKAINKYILSHSLLPNR